MTTRNLWPDYAAVWRWHFYAGLFCLPFVCWLALTGSIYLFRPDIEAWLDRPYENLQFAGSRMAPSQEVEAALRATPGSTFNRYETPATATGAAQILVNQGSNLMRIYIHPKTLSPMSVGRDDHRIMELIFNLHGNFLAGDKGSMLVELAASWAIVMLISGLYLWFPRNAKGIAGVLYPRLTRRGRILWRDLHAVTGVWVSLAALFMLLSGLPWATNWGTYLSWVRELSPVTSGSPDWTTGSAREAAIRRETIAATGKAESPARLRATVQERVITTAEPDAAAEAPRSMAGMSTEEMAAMAPSASTKAPATELTALDHIMPTVQRLNLPRPVWILPPKQLGGVWLAASETQTRPERITYTINPVNGQITGKNDFSTRNVVDKVVDVSIAIHEGQYFGRLNQAMLLVTAASLVLLTISATVMWWRRRPDGVLGAPRPVSCPRFSIGLIAIVIMLALIVPMFGASLLVVIAIERLILSRMPGPKRWLGLQNS